MKTHVQRSSILITPECPQDVAFIVDTLGLGVVGDYLVLRRVAVPVGEGVGSIIGLETVRVPESSDAAPVEEPSSGPKSVDELLAPEKSDDDDDSEKGGGSAAA